MSSRKATESYCFVHTMQYIYEEDKKSALEHLGWQATFKFRALWSVRDGKGLNSQCCRLDEGFNSNTKELIYVLFETVGILSKLDEVIIILTFIQKVPS